MATTAILYECNRRLAPQRRRAIEQAYAGLRLAAWSSSANGRKEYLARVCAEQCRSLIKTFGVRLARRFEITDEQRAEWRAHVAAHRPAEVAS